MKTYTEQELKNYFDWIAETNPYTEIGFQAKMMKKKMFDKSYSTYWNIDRVLKEELKENKS